MSGKVTTPTVCPECGGQSWTTTTKGPKCLKCGYLIDNAFLQTEKVKTVTK
jgi:tRNA(Ile2) C34 agmatinyltransferase TiaS